MSSAFDKLNLSPAERRLVVITGIVLFVLLNYFFIWPEFGEWPKNEQRIKDASAKLSTFKDEIARKAAYEKELKELEQQGNYVPTEEAALRLSQEVNSQAALSGVTLTSISPLIRGGTGSTGKTNAFFEEVSVTVNVNTSEKELLDFLFRLADKEMLIRAKMMNLNPDPSRMRLQGPITLVKSLQRKPLVKAAAKPGAATPAAKPTATPAAKPAAAPTPAPPAAASPSTKIPVPASPAGTNASTRRAPAPVKK